MSKRVGRWVMVLLLARCGIPALPSAPPSSTVPLGMVALHYRLLDFLTIGRGMTAIEWCDYEYYPVGRPEGFEERAQAAIQELVSTDPEGLRLIQQTTGILTDIQALDSSQQLALYQEIRNTKALHLYDNGDQTYQFRAYVKNEAAMTILTRGTITALGAIKVESQEASMVDCPTCLAATTLIATPDGEVPVQQLRAGDTVWTAEADGTRIAAPIEKVSRTAAPPQHQVLRATLSDGRSVSASLGHPTTDGRVFANLGAGDWLDGATLHEVTQAEYTLGWTYDLLPEGATGWYWADGVLLASTLTDRP